MTDNYRTSLRGNDSPKGPMKEHFSKEVSKEGLSFIVPQLSKVKTSTTCEAILKFDHEDTIANNYASRVDTTSYRRQGDESLNTPENLQERQHIRNSSRVETFLMRYWQTLNSVRTGSAVISQREYIDVFLKMFKALVRPDEVSPVGRSSGSSIMTLSSFRYWKLPVLFKKIGNEIWGIQCT